MVSTNPGSSPAIPRDAHYHAVKATATWAAFAAALRLEATNSAAERARRDELRADETTYARGILGLH